MSAGKGGTKKEAKAYPKNFYVPPDIKSLGGYATVLINQMRGWYQWRMTEGVRTMRKKG